MRCPGMRRTALRKSSQLKLYEDDDAEELLRQLLSKLEKEVGANV